MIAAGTRRFVCMNGFRVAGLKVAGSQVCGTQHSTFNTQNFLPQAEKETE
jgi:hypothetical protein